VFACEAIYTFQLDHQNVFYQDVGKIFA
jgi:hypothetical protein